MTIQKTVRLAVSGICIDEGKVLMVHQSGSELRYTFPGADVCVGERFIDTLERVCFDKLGVPVRVEGMVYTSERLFQADDGSDAFVAALYYVIAPEEEIDCDAHGAQWFELTDLPLDEMLLIDREMAEVLFAE
jgi:ADP-ribose pyrophosphatase YjhB (NUDIX family)